MVNNAQTTEQALFINHEAVQVLISILYTYMSQTCHVHVTSGYKSVHRQYI